MIPGQPLLPVPAISRSQVLPQAFQQATFHLGKWQSNGGRRSTDLQAEPNLANLEYTTVLSGSLLGCVTDVSGSLAGRAN